MEIVCKHLAIDIEFEGISCRRTVHASTKMKLLRFNLLDLLIRRIEKLFVARFVEILWGGSLRLLRLLRLVGVVYVVVEYYRVTLFSIFRETNVAVIGERTHRLVSLQIV